MMETGVTSKMIDELLNGIMNPLADSDLPVDTSDFKSWIGTDEISTYLLNTNKKHPIRGFVVEVASIRWKFSFFIFRYCRLWNRRLHSLSTIT